MRGRRSLSAGVAYFFRHRQRPYAGADLVPARRIAVPALVLTGIFSGLSLALAPPTRVGGQGMVLAAVAVAAFVVPALVLRRRGERTAPDTLLLISYLAVLAIAVMQLLSAGGKAPVSPILLVWAAYTGAVHPPRRALCFLAVLSAVAVFPVAYENYESVAAVQLGVQVVLWVVLGLFACAWTDEVRAKRIVMQQEGDAARASARTDRLTGLGNRLAFDELIDAELARARLGRRPLSVLVADLDGFKTLNDRHGHLIGDGCLKDVAATLQSGGRGLDRAFRWGGDEFVYVLPDTAVEDADLLAQRLRRAVRDECFGPEGEPLTMTTGVGQAMPKDDADSLLGRADRALMDEKQRALRPRELPVPVMESTFRE